MSSKPIAEAKDQPAAFAWTAESEAEIARYLAKYPESRKASAVLPLLDARPPAPPVARLDD